MAHLVRPAEPADLPLLAGVEQAADRLLVDALGPDLLVATTPGRLRAAEPGFLLVVGRPVVGFAHVVEEDGTAHLQQLVVDPAHGRRGHGRALVEECCVEADRRGYRELTLTTFRDVAFNAPYYERLGFAVLAEPTGLVAAHLADEAAQGYVQPRVGMVRRW